MRNVSEKLVEKIKTCILCSINFSRKTCGLWDNMGNMVQPDSSQMTVKYGARALQGG
jgi:hypothetical protein